MRNQLQTYLLPDDESALSLALRKVSPTLVFIDHDEAAAGNAKVHSDLNACASGYAYIWDAETEDSIIALAKWNELVRRKSGRGALVQFLRSRIRTDELVTGETVTLLLSGRVAMMGSGIEEQKSLKTLVYKTLSSLATADVFPVSPTTREPIGLKQAGSRVGFHAVAWCKDSSHLLRHSANSLLYGLPMVQRGK